MDVVASPACSQACMSNVQLCMQNKVKEKVFECILYSVQTVHVCTCCASYSFLVVAIRSSID